jgi:acyl carrier protein
MIVNRLDLAIDPDWIMNDQPLFGRGLELDSIDTLELILGVESDFDVSLSEDDRWAFGSVAKLAEYIAQDLADRAAAR